jgi:hypothetical protein
MKSFSLHSLLFFIPDDIFSLISNDAIYKIVIGILCILLTFSLIALYRRFKNGSARALLEGMTTTPDPDATTADGLDPDVKDLKKQADFLQTTYDQLKQGVDDQTNRINGNSHTLLKSMSDTPSETNNLTHANINSDDPSKTKIPNIDMS